MAIVRMAAKDGTELYIETDESPEVTLALRQQGPATTLRAPKVPSFGEIGERIATVCSEVRREIDKKGELSPNKLTLAFGIKVSGEAGIPLISNAKAEATFTVTAEWTHTQIASVPSAQVLR
jgi:hypothetical protein